MKQVTLDIPDAEYDFFMALVQKFNYKSSKENEYAISPEIMQMVDERRKSAKASDYITVEESNKRLKKKYGF